MPVGHLCVFSGEMSIYVFSPFLIGLDFLGGIAIELNELFIYFGN